MIYLSSPYTSAPSENFAGNVLAIGAMFRNARNIGCAIDIFSPVIQDYNVYNICNFSEEEKKYNYSNGVNWGMLEKSDCLVVLMLDGWEHSTGVKLEVEHAKINNIPIEYLSLSDINKCSEKVKEILIKYKR